MSKDILYSPNLGYKKNYYTEGKIDSDINSSNNTEDSSLNITKEENINNLINKIEENMQFIPTEFISIYLSPFFGMKDEYDRLKIEIREPIDNSEPAPEDDNTITIKPIDPIIEDDKNDGDEPDLFEDLDNLIIEVDEIKDPVDVIRDEYYTDFIDIYEDYLDKMDLVMESYTLAVGQVLSANATDDMLIDYDTRNIKNENLKHLSDYIIKSNVSLIQLLRLHKKLFHIDEIITHVRNIRIANEQRLRYNGIKELEQKTFLDVDSNIILKESIRVSEKKYEENLYGLYKYLNSSVILFNESLNTMSKQNIAMMTINNYEERG